MKKADYNKVFWKSLPLKSYIKLLITLFFIFSTFGFINDLFSGGKYSYQHLGINTIFSGIIGLFYAHAAIKNFKLFPIAFILHFLIIILISEIQFENYLEVPNSKFVVLAIGFLVFILLAYTSMMIFISGEGIPHIKLKTEIDLAKKMHDVLVPIIDFENDKFQIYGKTLPVTEVGGDLVDLYKSEDSHICYIADVSGHGVAAGLFMGMFKSSVHTLLLNNNDLNVIIRNSNNALNKLRKSNMFLTTSIIKFNSDYSADYLIAGHLPILHYNSDRKVVDQLLIKQIPVSVKRDYNFISKRLNFKVGDIFILLSDGLTEVKDENNVEFGISRIEELLLKNSNLSSEELYKIIMDNIEKSGKQHDDQSLMIIKCK